MQPTDTLSRLKRCCKLISACRSGEQWQKALSHLVSLNDSAVGANVFIMNAAIASCISCRKWKQASFLFADISSSGIQSDGITYNSVLGMCDLGLWQRGLNLLEGMTTVALQQDVFSCNTALNGCNKAATWQRAQNVFELQKQLAISPDTITANSILSACAACRRWKDAAVLLGGMSSTYLQSDIISHSSALAACSGRQWVQGAVLLRRLQNRHIRLNVLTCNTAISSSADRQESEPAHSCWHLALQVLGEMGEIVRKDVITYNACIAAANTANRWELAQQLFRHTSQAGLAANVRTHNALVAASDEGGRWQGGIVLLGTMHVASLQPDEVTFSSIQTMSAQSMQLGCC